MKQSNLGIGVGFGLALLPIPGFHDRKPGLVRQWSPYLLPPTPGKQAAPGSGHGSPLTGWNMSGSNLFNRVDSKETPKRIISANFHLNVELSYHG